MPVISINGQAPVVAQSTWVAANVVLVGAVELADDCGIYYGCVLRADSDRITIARGTNIQDGCVLHADPGFPVKVGENVSVGHRAILHGCTIENDVLIGMGAIVLNGAYIGSGSLIAAGAVILEGSNIPPNSLVAGVPAKIRRETSAEERAAIVQNAITYNELSALNAAGEIESGDF
jgi:carbonic anhydrase/acetyltransferase-like protein (isoleucine patch superfamily)